MQLPSSSATTDPSLAALLFPDATPTRCGTSTGNKAPATDVAFAQLFNRLNDEGSTKCPPGEDAPTLNGLLARECELEEVSVDFESGDIAWEAEGRTTGEKSTLLPSRTGRRGTERSTNVMPGESRPTASSGQPATSPDAVATFHQPDEHAADPAFETPRFTGLPAAALEHRDSQTQPPGIEQLMSERARLEAIDDASAEPTSVVVDAADAELESSVAGASEVNSAEPVAAEAPVQNRALPEPKSEKAFPPLPAAAGAERRAIFAVVPGEIRTDGDIAENAPEKSFVEGGEEHVRPSDVTLGIGVAKPAPVMSARLLPASVRHPASEYAGVPSPALNALSDAHAQSEAGEPAVIASAHEAVEIVLTAVAALSAREQRAVQLEFSIGDAELLVRVELHGDEVRTTFRTASADLRTALAQEWQAVTGNAPGDRPFRLAPALFTASENSAHSAFADDTSSRQRDPRTFGRPEERTIITASRARRAGASVAHAPAAPIPTTRTSHRLHTVA